MKLTFSIAFLCFISTLTHSQQKLGIRLCHNIDRFTVYYHSGGAEQTKSERFNYIRPSLSLNITNRRAYTHALEMSIPEISRSDERMKLPATYYLASGIYTTEVSTFSLRYELTKAITDPSKQLVFNAGIAINPYFIHENSKPGEPYAYNMRQETYAVSFNIIPRLSFRPADRFTIDMCIPFKIYDFFNIASKIDNPAIPIRQQRNSITEDSFFEKIYTFQVGIMYSIK
jgi:hypothetical protein